MPTVVEMPNGVELEFPDGMAQDAMRAAAAKYWQGESGQGGPIEPAQPEAPAPDPAANDSFLDYVPLVSQGLDVMDMLSQGLPDGNVPPSVERRAGRRDDAAHFLTSLVLGGGAGGVGAKLGAAALPKVLSAAGSVAGAGAGTAVGEGVADATRGEFNPDELAQAALFGAGGQAAGEVLGAGARLFRGAAPQATDEAVAAAAAADELNIPLTRGQATGNIDQFRVEEAIRQRGGVAAEPLVDLAERQQAAIDNVVSEIAPGFGREVGEAGTEGITALTQARDAQRAAVRAAYEAAENTNGAVSGEAFKPLLKNIRQHIDEFSGFDYDLKARLQNAYKGISQPAQDIGEDGTATIAEIDTIRKALNRTINAAKGPDKAALKSGLIGIKGEFDTWLDDVVDSALFTGDEAALTAIKKARGMSAQFKSRFASGPGDAGGKIIEKLLDENVDDAVNYLFGVSTLAKSGTGNAISRIGEASPEALQAFRQAAWSRLTSKNGEALSPAQFSTKLKKHLADHPDVMSKLFTGDQIGKMRKLVQVMDAAKTPADALNPSRSGWTILKGLRETLGSNLLLAGVGGAAITGNPLVGAAIAAPALKNTVGAIMRGRNAARPLTGPAGGFLPDFAPEAGRIAGQLSAPREERTNTTTTLVGTRRGSPSVTERSTVPASTHAAEVQRLLLEGSI